MSKNLYMKKVGEKAKLASMENTLREIRQTLEEKNVELDSLQVVMTENKDKMEQREKEFEKKFWRKRLRRKIIR